MSGVRGGPTPPLVILVGLTGVGKSTAVKALRSSRPGAVVLPNRRELADRIVIPEAQRLEGEPPHPVQDRLERFRLTARYRAAHRGGLAHALQRHLQQAAAPAASLLLFDNLRGESEVRFAESAFPDARFIVLEAPADVRVLRLAGRRDAFDRVAPLAPGPDGAPARGDEVLLRQLREVPGLDGLADVPALAAAAHGLDREAVLTGARVVAEESAHYDPEAAWACLAHLPPARCIRLDTGHRPPGHVAARLRAWL